MNYDAHILDPFVAPASKPPRETMPRIRVVCLECDRKFSTTNPLPECPRCGGTDIEVA